MLNLLRRLLGIADIIVGVMLIFGLKIPFLNFFIYVHLVKGVWSIISSIAAGYYLDWMGALDVLAGLGLFGVGRGWHVFFFPVLGMGMVLKGVISVV